MTTQSAKLMLEERPYLIAAYDKCGSFQEEFALTFDEALAIYERFEQGLKGTEHHLVLRNWCQSDHKFDGLTEDEREKFEAIYSNS